MSEHEQLAKRMIESSALSNERSSIELSPLEQLIARVQVRWPFPEMGDLEYLDWKESLKSSPLKKIQAALDHIMRNPPRSEQGEYRGRPTVVDVLRTMDILADEQAKKWVKEQAEKERQEQIQLEQRKAEHPEEFIGMKELQEIAQKLQGVGRIAKSAAAHVFMPSLTNKPNSCDICGKTRAEGSHMPNVRTVFPDIDPDRNAEKLRKQAEMLKGKP